MKKTKKQKNSRIRRGIDRFLNWLDSYYVLYYGWHETKKQQIYIGIEWSAGWIFLVGVDFWGGHSIDFRLLGFKIKFHHLLKKKEYWGKKKTSKD